MGEHLPYKQRVTGSSPVLSTIAEMRFYRSLRASIGNGLVAQLVRALACHARGRGFEPHPSRHSDASVAQLVEQGTENPRVVGSIPTGGTICGFSSFGRASPCQGEGGGFEPRNPLHFILKDKLNIRLVLFLFILTNADYGVFPTTEFF